LHAYIQAHYGKQYHEILINTHVRVGNVSEELTELAMVLGSDLLLVGKHYQKRFSFFDDTANSLISTCPCPVMTIPENAQYSFIKRIIYASTFLLEDCDAIFQLKQWLKTFNGELICINVSKDKSQLVTAKRKMAILERLFPQEDITFRCFMSEKSLSIERYTSLNEGDLLCSMHKDRNMFQWLFQPSTSKALANKSPRPMIIFHQHMLSSKF
jgi:nucleotide-binding universal stress UspA family protein